MEIEKLANIEITDEDILWVEEMMGGKVHFDSASVNVLKNMDSVDIQAFPGSGKTTILVAKLAILAKKWPYSNAGICVLSHTNVAREEIEERLGNTEVGRKLLSYPHFIGTVHSFFDTYVSLPWLKSNGYEINIIDTELVHSLRWNKLPRNKRYYLEMQYKSETICEYRDNIGNIERVKNEETNELLLSVIEKTQKDGYFTFGEMLLYAQKVLKEWDEIPKAIQRRFPILFIDEAQDTDTFQWNLLKKAFNSDGELSIRQGFGDSNQAIYGNLYADDTTENFPRENALVLSESRRFDSSISSLANTVALSKAQMDGTDNEFTQKGIKHTIFLFEKENAAQVIDEFGQLILDTFSDEELKTYEKEGVHVIGMIHDKKEETKDNQFPKGIYDYWNAYEARKANKRTTPKNLIDYFRKGIEEFQNNGEKSEQIEWICKGLRRLVNKAKECNYIPATGNSINAIMKLLSDEQKKDFRKLLMLLADFGNLIFKEDWKSMVIIMKKILSLFETEPNEDVNKFGKWVEDQEKSNENSNENSDDKKLLPNYYVYCDEETKREVDMEFGSIHSVKGRTHLATLVLETFMKSHNMKSILDYLCGEPPKRMKSSSEKRLKCQYVAMTRARALICLAIPIDFVGFIRNYPYHSTLTYISFAAKSALLHLPYIVRFTIFNLLFVPSTKPFESSLATEFSTASISFSNPFANRNISFKSEFLYRSINKYNRGILFFSYISRNSRTQCINSLSLGYFCKIYALWFSLSSTPIQR